MRSTRRRRLTFLVTAVLASLALLVAMARAQQSPAPAASLTGQIHVMWGDPVSGQPAPLPHAMLVDDEGRWHRLRIDAALLDRLGGAQRLHQRRGRVSGRAAAPGARARAANAPEVDVDSVEVESAEASPAPLAVMGAQPWLTILCRFADSRGVTPRPASYFETMMSATRPGLTHYWKQVSYGRVSLAGSRVVGWYDLPAPRSHYVYATGADGAEHLDFQRSAEDCTAAANRDVTLSDYAGINLMFNDSLDCCSWGGGATLTRDGVARAYRVTWLPPWAYAQQYIVAHEMGHGFGLPHSSGPYGSAYDSDWDTMSGGGTCSAPDPVLGCAGVHTIAHHKSLLGWIDPARQFTPAAGQNATILIERLAKPKVDSSYLMARIPVPGSSTRFYTVEARRRAGYDTEIPAEAIVIHDVDPSRGDRAAQVVDPDANGNPNDAGAQWTPGEAFSDGASEISVVVDAATDTGFQVTVLTKGFRLAVARGGDGAGTVTSSGPGIACGTSCAAVYDAGTLVTLTASAQGASAFAGFVGCDTVSGTLCTVQMSASRSVSALFARRPMLSVVVNGIGTVRSAPGGIDCGASCAATYPSGTAVSLRATPGPQSVFAGWTGSADCADGVVSLSGDTTCTATFRPAPDLAITAVSNPPTSLRPGDRFSLVDTATNRGLAPAGAFRIRYFLSASAATSPAGTALPGRRLVSGLAAGASTTGATALAVPLTMPPGTYTLLACADVTNAVAESDETGNCRAAATPVTISRRAP